jgi:multidrug efflux pump subunit AcrB
MWLVNAALRHRYTVWVGMLLALVLGVMSYLRTPTDILPALKVPVVVVFASYRGMPAPDMEQSVTAVLERALNRCDHLEHIESRSLLGIGIIQVYFRPQVDPDVATGQVISLVQGEMQNMPPGMLFPSILKYDASAIPVGNLIISSKSRGDKELLDLADHEIRDALSNIEGLASAPVFGGVFRQVQIYVDPVKLEAHNLSPMEVAQVVNRQSQIIPTGEARFGPQTYYVSSNSMVKTPEEFENIALKSVGRRVVHLGDVAKVVDGERWRTNTVLADGRRAVYMPLLRQGGASAIKVVDNVQDFLPELYKRGLPDDVQVEVAFDQSQYVRDALRNLQLEAVLGAVLASLVVVLFLGSLRSSLIVALSIPLSILAALIGLYFTGHTLNIMTLGGIALVLGRVVDDSIVDVENTVRHLGLGKTPLDAARASAEEISIPVLMATVTTVVVFFPITFMTGLGKYLFTPLAVSAAFAMAASYVVSRTVSPLFCSQYLKPHGHKERFPVWLFLSGLAAAAVGLAYPVLALWLPDRVGLSAEVRDTLTWPVLKLGQGGRTGLVVGGAVGLVVVLVGLLFWVSPLFQRLFEAMTRAYGRALGWALRLRWAVLGGLAVLLVPAGWLFFHTSQELFPEVDSSDFTIHLRATGGPRVEETEHQVRDIEEIVRQVIPEEDLELTLSNVGISSRWSAIYTPNNGPHAAFIRVQLRSGFAGRHTSATTYVERLRRKLAQKYPGDDFFFETGGMIRHILNAGAVAPIEVQVHARDSVLRRALARRLDRRIGRIPQVKDTYMPQGMDLPQLRIDVDRTKARLLGFTETEVIRNVITALMSSAQLAPNFWIDPATGNPYVIGAQYAQDVVTDIHTLEGIPISKEGMGSAATAPRVRPDQVAAIERTQGPVEVFHHNVDRVSQIFVSVGDQDLAGVAAEIERIVAEFPLKHALDLIEPPARRQRLANDEAFKEALEAYLREGQKPEHLHAQRARIMDHYKVDPELLRLPKGVRFTVRGEIKSMRESFGEMTFNLVLAVLLVYLIMAAQFASWVDPLIMIVSAPLGLVGVVAVLWLTGTSLNIQSFMGVLMMVGISVSNSVLVVEFANRQRRDGQDTRTAIVNAARVRLQPILMTTLATIVGLTPMAVHLHPGDEMNLPLARAVIGGLAGSTLLTLFVVPVLYVLLKPRGPAAEPAEGGAA